ncbi:quinoprotein dehydrogenase-associated SoxYZ-like carrier [Telmatospirillum siberiense]|nr:quinoprotein dehydrogenase-associated SoxYZ-like carrier [Telmatospirillum siberiense]
MRSSKPVLAVLTLLLTGLTVPCPAVAEDGAAAEARWEDIRSALFKGKTLIDGSDVLELQAPARAVEAALVPVGVHVKFPQTAERYVTSLSLVIDENPAPLAAVFHFTPDSGQADIETRLRVNDYTYIHAVAETNDGKTYVVRTYVKAAGGCSAPMSKNAEAEAGHLGEMRFQQIGAFQPDVPNRAQVMIRHPNNSGMQMDQITRLYLPAHYVQSIAVTLDGKPVLAIDADISLSEDPHFRFFYLPHGPATLKISARDNLDQTFSGSWAVGPAGR